MVQSSKQGSASMRTTAPNQRCFLPDPAPLPAPPPLSASLTAGVAAALLGVAAALPVRRLARPTLAA